MVEVISWGSDLSGELSFEEILGGVLVRMAFGQEHHTVVTTVVTVTICLKGNIKDWFSLHVATTSPLKGAKNVNILSYIVHVDRSTYLLLDNNKLS